MEVEEVQVTAEQLVQKKYKFYNVWSILLIVYSVYWSILRLILVFNYQNNYTLIFIEGFYLVYVFITITVYSFVVFYKRKSANKEESFKNLVTSWQIAETCLLVFNVLFTTGITVLLCIFNSLNDYYVISLLVFIVFDWIMIITRIVFIVRACKATRSV